ncbi:MAG: 2-amino-4-hydroxy-6-hydroxymethyldihydropteridine diphosphokinase [Acidobacteriota bacterium]
MGRVAAAPTPIAVALGSNTGDRHAHLAAAVSGLRRFLDDIRVSRWRETPFEPVDGTDPGPQPPVLNGAVVGTTALDARAVLDRLQALESAAGRTRPFRGAARTLDLDLILYGTLVLREPGLEVPHPRFRARLFVLEPLAELAPDWVDPVTGRTISALLRAARPS